jgi:hypothetical protein
MRVSAQRADYLRHGQHDEDWPTVLTHGRGTPLGTKGREGCALITGIQTSTTCGSTQPHSGSGRAAES